MKHTWFCPGGQPPTAARAGLAVTAETTTDRAGARRAEGDGSMGPGGIDRMCRCGCEIDHAELLTLEVGERDTGDLDRALTAQRRLRGVLAGIQRRAGGDDLEGRAGRVGRLRRAV